MLRVIMIMMITGLPVATAATLTSPLSDNLTAYNAAVWKKSDGWSNGAQFQVGWRADHLAFAGSGMTIQLDNQPGCSTASAACSQQPFASGEYQSIDMISYGRFTFRARAASASGVITGLFSYTGPADGQPHDEIDIEFLGKNTRQVQFNYFVAGIGGHEKIVTLGFDAAAALHDYTIEWLPAVINWYVDGVLKYSVFAGAGTNLPSYPQHIFMNLWAATGVDVWSGPFVYTGIALTAQLAQISYIPAVGAAPVAAAVGAPVATATVTGGGCSIASSTDSRYADASLWLLLLLLGLRFTLQQRFIAKPKH